MDGPICFANCFLTPPRTSLVATLRYAHRAFLFLFLFALGRFPTHVSLDIETVHRVITTLRRKLEG